MDQQPHLPPLPQLSLDDRPATVRAAIQKPYDAVQAAPLDSSANGKLGMMLHAHGLLEEARACYERAHLLDPKSFRWAYYLGIVQAARGKYNEAVVSLRTALRVDPEYYPAQLRFGESLLGVGKLEEASQLFEEIIRAYPESAPAHYGLGRVRTALKDYQGAVESFSKACQLFPRFAAAHFALARAYQRLGRAELTQKEVVLSQQSRGASPEVQDELLDEVRLLRQDAEFYIKLAATLEHDRNLEEAVKAYERAVEINPQLPEPHVRLIHLYGRLGQPAQADEHYRAALRLDPNRAEAHLYYGVLLTAQDKREEAEEAFRKAVAANPRHAEAHNNLGYVLEAQGKTTEAREEFRKALEQNPDFPQAHFNLGRILVKQENYEEGIPHLLKSLAEGRSEVKASYLHAVGIAFASLGDLENALRYLRLARQQAVASNQMKLLGSIEDDLRLLDSGPVPQQR